MVSRVCEEFHCLPAEAVAAILDDPEHLALDIIELRAYARTKEQLDTAKRPEDAPTGPVVDWVFEVQAERLRSKRED